MLNTHYEGGATGETFNAAGKTDILIRVEDRNVFIGECKWWSGAAGFPRRARPALLLHDLAGHKARIDLLR